MKHSLSRYTFFAATLALFAFLACKEITGPASPAKAPELLFDEDGSPLVNITITMGGGGGATIPYRRDGGTLL